MLEIRLLGQFELKLEGVVVEIPTRPAQSLFAYLAMSAGVAHRREKLAGLFWPDADETNARSNLRHALWRIRKALGRAEFILSDDLTITFNKESNYWLDTAVFQFPTSQSPISNPLSWYGGDLLPGFYDEWVAPERERLRAIFDRKTAEYLDELVKKAHWTAVLESAERWLALGDAPETAFCALMQAYAGLGEVNRLTAVYQRCVAALHQQLGVEPAPKTQALYHRLLHTPPPAKPTHNLPRQLTSFIGRHQDLATLLSLLSPRSSLPSLLTLTGPGGSGKTRLALELATAVSQTDTFPDGIWLAELASLNDPSQLVQTVAEVLGVQAENGRSLAAALQLRHLLLILDNCEHLIEACAHLAQALLTACRHVTVLATSREPLNIPGEQVHRLAPLSLPDPYSVGSRTPPTELMTYEAIQLFCERAAAAQPGFTLTADNGTAVFHICHRLDGIPLAIELAAAHAALLHPHEILRHLDDRFRLLTGGSRAALPRQQTLLAAIEWSYQLLTPTEQQLFWQLSVFTGGWTLETAESLLSPPSSLLAPLTALVQKSLVVAEPHPMHPTRYHFLETIRQFAQQKLIEAGEFEQMHQQHMEWFMKTAESAIHTLQSSHSPAWLHWLETENPNLRTALAWANHTNHPAAEPLTGLMGQVWYIQALSRNNSIEQQAQTLYGMGFLAWAQGNYQLAGQLHSRGLALAQQADDTEAVVKHLLGLARTAVSQSDLPQAASWLEQVMVFCLAEGVALALAELMEYKRLENMIFHGH